MITNHRLLFNNLLLHKTLTRTLSNHLTEEEKTEYLDPELVFEEKSKRLAEMILESKHFIAFTGAGISTTAGIPDYRSGANTLVPTGPGHWEAKPENYLKVNTHLNQAIPTYTHMALAELMRRGYLKYVISQNVDGLHLKSGIDPNNLAELHGNSNIEKCVKCSKQYFRDYKVRITGSKDHLTGNLCDDPGCRGVLKDNIVHFGDSLDKDLLKQCFNQAASADLCLALGSSIRVKPAALFPGIAAKNGKLVIVNLQKTPFDSIGLKINSFCDPLARSVMKKTGIEVEEFKVRKKFGVKTWDGKVLVRGLDKKGGDFYIFKKVKFGDVEITKEPFLAESRRMKIELFFHGHYGEPEFCFEFNGAEETEKIYEIEYELKGEKWKIERIV